MHGKYRRYYGNKEKGWETRRWEGQKNVFEGSSKFTCGTLVANRPYVNLPTWARATECCRNHSACSSMHDDSVRQPSVKLFYVWFDLDNQTTWLELWNSCSFLKFRQQKDLVRLRKRSSFGLKTLRLHTLCNLSTLHKLKKSTLNYSFTQGTDSGPHLSTPPSATRGLSHFLYTSSFATVVISTAT